MKNVIVAGPRNFANINLVFKILNEELEYEKHNITIFNGGATGVDAIGKLWAEANDIPVRPFPADWKNLDRKPCLVKYDKYNRPYNALAGLNRNEEMAQEADTLILIWDGFTNGSSDMKERAKKHGLRIIEYIIKHKVEKKI